MDVRSLYAAQQYAQTRPATEPGEGEASAVQDRFTELAQDFETTLREAETAATESMTGDADPHALVNALAQSELAVETVVAVRDKVVEAYQEILRMPV